jgi:hypothetical protein
LLEILNNFLYLDPVKSRCVPGPNKRSGHRVFATDDHLYVVGGFNSVGASIGSSTFKDIWKLNLLTNQWTELKLIGNFDDTMVSSSSNLVNFCILGLIFLGFCSRIGQVLRVRWHGVSFCRERFVEFVRMHFDRRRYLQGGEVAYHWR